MTKDQLYKKLYYARPESYFAENNNKTLFMVTNGFENHVCWKILQEDGLKKTYYDFAQDFAKAVDFLFSE